MTFLEAAMAILKREGKPLHFKKLTEIALKENLLTVVGRTPEATMQQRLNDAIKKDETLPLTREKPGVFGLRYYPPRGSAGEGAAEPAEAEDADAAPAEEAAKSGGEPRPEGEGRKRRRRGGRGRRRRGGATDTAEAAAGRDGAAPAADESNGEAAVAPNGEPREESESDELLERPSLEAAAERTPTEPGRMSFAAAAAQVAAAHGRDLTAPEPLPPVPEVPDEPGAEIGGDADAQDEDELADQIDAPSGPLIAPAFGTEELVKGEDHREVYEQPRGGRRRRGRDRGGRDRGREERSGHGRQEQPRRAEPHAEQRAVEPQRESRPQSPPDRRDRPQGAEGVVEAVAEVLRGGDGRPLHVRQIVDQALKRKLLRGESQELWRLVRAAVLVEQRAREQAGRRPRVRTVGGGQLAAADRKLDGELAQYERELGERAARLSEATRVALHRRLARLSPAAFEALGRLLLERIGVAQVELVKRGDGVAYFGGTRARAGSQLKVLAALRPGEGELPRRAVGELRAGLKARGFDEGVLLAAGRAGSEALAELAAGAGPIEWYDGEQLSTLCARLGVGVVKRAVAVDTLDVELFGELNEGS